MSANGRRIRAPVDIRLFWRATVELRKLPVCHHPSAYIFQVVCEIVEIPIDSRGSSEY